MPVNTLGLLPPSFKVNSIEGSNPVIIKAEYRGQVSCPACHGRELRTKDRIERRVRHESIGTRNTWLYLTLRKYHCLHCGRYFRVRVPGLLPYRRSTEMFRREVFSDHWSGISQQQLRRHRWIGTATVERWFHEMLELKERMFASRSCPRVLGIDEHFFSRKDGYVTTFCDLEKHRVFELAKGRSERALSSALSKMKDRHLVRVVCIDLSPTYRAIVRKYFPNAKIVADRFHVIRLVQHHFLKTWQRIDPEGRKNRGLLSLMRRRADKLNPDQKTRLQQYFKQQPTVGIIYQAKEQICKLLNKKAQNHRSCKKLIPKLIEYIKSLRRTPFPPLLTLADTLESWSKEIVRMWRFTKNNGITEGFHTKMEMIKRRAFGFRNFANYRLRVIVLCS